MICRNCNHQNNEGSFCGRCGAPLYQNSGNQMYGQYAQNNTQQMYGQYAPNNTQQMYGQYAQPNMAQPRFYHPMKWYKWLIYFGLFFSSFMCLSGLWYINGDIYSMVSFDLVTSDDVYIAFGDGLKVLDIIYGIVLLCMIPLNLVTRQKLAKFKKDAPTYINMVYGISCGAGILYTIASSIITGTFDSGSITSIASSWIFFANKKYFDTRHYLFRN